MDHPDPHTVARDLASWFRDRQRDLPWRGVEDPYRVLVAEVMLQQTTVATVRDRYGGFLERFPTVEALAAATEDAVLQAWAGLGYYRRARNLHAAAGRIVEGHDGEVPQDVDALRDLPGVGPYTAGAVASIAFDLPEPSIDANQERVIARLLAETGNVRRASPRRRVRAFAQQVLEAGGSPGDLNQALMELGSLVCHPRDPRCEACPVADACRARRLGIAERLPVKDTPRAPTPVTVVALVLRSGDRVLLTRAPPDGLLPGTWGFPWVELSEEGEPVEAGLGHASRMGFAVASAGVAARFPYTFSHRRWDLHVLRAEVEDGGAPEAARWVRVEDLPDVGLPTVHRRVADRTL